MGMKSAFNPGQAIIDAILADGTLWPVCQLLLVSLFVSASLVARSYLGDFATYFPHARPGF